MLIRCCPAGRSGEDPRNGRAGDAGARNPFARCSAPVHISSRDLDGVRPRRRPPPQTQADAAVPPASPPLASPPLPQTAWLRQRALVVRSFQNGKRGCGPIDIISRTKWDSYNLLRRQTPDRQVCHCCRSCSARARCPRCRAPARSNFAARVTGSSYEISTCRPSATPRCCRCRAHPEATNSLDITTNAGAVAVSAPATDSALPASAGLLLATGASSLRAAAGEAEVALLPCTCVPCSCPQAASRSCRSRPAPCRRLHSGSRSNSSSGESPGKRVGHGW